ncbi:MBL fold metallo-hydrolase [Aeromicrobium sp. PE09-221]|uniref:MBL fold metallo-hydrolase n=1 Tax=Aeromicrobium sp. PE09-221 TaxID=1898043 RepID=UPI000B3E678C|nr:MBL fold metallo-hydrolase [Aeromicrobium sp. PE09-221]OUZ06767.1 MBL fold metallo-hydrolase [Aeromicrobium sp. PE09-221]
MRVHHLNCGTMRPLGTPEGLVCHVLLLELDDRLALVDSGFGLADVADHARPLGPARFFFRPAFDEAETATRQIEALGLDPKDVRDIVVTHFDGDHVGGLADFPWANVHITAAEADAFARPRGQVEKGRYLPALRAHGPAIVQHSPLVGDTWRGFGAATELTEVGENVVLLSMPGHTRGHACVAVGADHGWIFHAGDAVLHRGSVESDPKVPLAVRGMERTMATDWSKVRLNHARLTELAGGSEPDVTLVNGHDPELLRRAQASAVAVWGQ